MCVNEREGEGGERKRMSDREREINRQTDRAYHMTALKGFS